MKIGIALAAVAVFSTATLAQQPYAGMETRAIKTLSDQQVADLQAGRGMGLALAAELNGYPGPAHAIELADKLGLSSEQLGKIKELFAAMKAETIPIGAQLIEEERSLNAAFAGKTITLASLEMGTQQIGATQAKLRAAHLKYHLATVAIMTPEQIATYNALRGYAGGASPPQHQQQHHMHH
ncbi:MAG TPA: Spy/CpxP family protein refolding chaperone [Pseudolabrys sp.]|nr:Spy/CpxP family protein refolding chaperone [Pseudolabrys sp.]